MTVRKSTSHGSDEAAGSDVMFEEEDDELWRGFAEVNGDGLSETTCRDSFSTSCTTSTAALLPDAPMAMFASFLDGKRSFSGRPTKLAVIQSRYAVTWLAL